MDHLLYNSGQLLAENVPPLPHRRRGRHPRLHLFQGHPHHPLPPHRRSLRGNQAHDLLLHQILWQPHPPPHPPRRRLRHGCHLRRRTFPRPESRLRPIENLLRRRGQDRRSRNQRRTRRRHRRLQHRVGRGILESRPHRRRIGHAPPAASCASTPTCKNRTTHNIKPFTSRKEDKFGINTSTAPPISTAKASKAKHVELHGLHLHIGSPIKLPALFRSHCQGPRPH